MILIDRRALSSCVAIPKMNDGKELLPPTEAKAPLYKGVDVTALRGAALRPIRRRSRWRRARA